MRFLLLFSTFGSMVYVGLMFMVQLEASLDLHKSDVFFTIYSAFFWRTAYLRISHLIGKWPELSVRTSLDDNK